MVNWYTGCLVEHEWRPGGREGGEGGNESRKLMMVD